MKGWTSFRIIPITVVAFLWLKTSLNRHIIVFRIISWKSKFLSSFYVNTFNSSFDKEGSKFQTRISRFVVSPRIPSILAKSIEHPWLALELRNFSLIVDLTLSTTKRTVSLFVRNYKQYFREVNSYWVGSLQKYVLTKAPRALN